MALNRRPENRNSSSLTIQQVARDHGISLNEARRLIIEHLDLHARTHSVLDQLENDSNGHIRLIRGKVRLTRENSQRRLVDPGEANTGISVQTSKKIKTSRQDREKQLRDYRKYRLPKGQTKSRIVIEAFVKTNCDFWEAFHLVKQHPAFSDCNDIWLKKRMYEFRSYYKPVILELMGLAPTDHLPGVKVYKRDRAEAVSQANTELDAACLTGYPDSPTI